MNTGKSATTYKKRMLVRHNDWLKATKNLYNEVVEFYYGLFMSLERVWTLSCQNALRELEILTLTSKSGNAPQIVTPFEKVPSYFRRAAINTALAMGHSYISKTENSQANYINTINEGSKTTSNSFQNNDNDKNIDKNVMNYSASAPKIGLAESFNTSPVFYKGMYKELTSNRIVLKLYTGASWAWVSVKLKGREIPLNGEALSPSLCCKGNEFWLHIPVVTQVEDIRAVKERMSAGENVCGISFSNTNNFATCSSMTAEGRAISCHFCGGGDEYAHLSKLLLAKIKRSNKCMGTHFDWTNANKKYWIKLYNLSDYYAHKVSKEIVDFCIKNNVKTISITESAQLPQIIKKNLSKYSPLYLSKRIKRYLQYKAWASGIVITKVRANYTAMKCAQCREYIEKASAKAKLYTCKNGHNGNKSLNTAKNIASYCLKKFGKLTA